MKSKGIKWIKYRRSKCEFALCREDKVPCEEYKFWRDKLNITEEDLK